jgi:hypothetical protein
MPGMHRTRPATTRTLMAGIISFFTQLVGTIDVEQPVFSVVPRQGLDATTWEVREYPATVAVETTPGDNVDGLTEKQIDGDMFRRLAKYIGVFTTPMNKARETADGDSLQPSPEAVAMTAPVLTSQSEPSPEAIAMTAPVVTSTASTGKATRSMAFLLPSKYTIDTAPTPTDPLVTLRQVPARTVVAHRFSGNIRHNEAGELLDNLRPSLETAGMKVVSWELARYNPPWTFPWLRTNDLLVTVTEEHQ